MHKFIGLLLLAGLLTMLSCTSNTLENLAGGDAVVVEQDGKIFIQDRRGALWDVTYGVENFGFFPERFAHGHGRDRFIPINDPQFYEPGTSEWPGIEIGDRVIGFELDGDTRAYPTNALRGIEIANDSFGDTHVSVGW